MSPGAPVAEVTWPANAIRVPRPGACVGAPADMRVLVVAALTAAAGALTTGPVGAAEPDGGRVPIPEPVLAETVADIDGTEAGELELEVNGASLRALHGGRYAIDGSLEVEWLVL